MEKDTERYVCSEIDAWWLGFEPDRIKNVIPKEHLLNIYDRTPLIIVLKNIHNEKAILSILNFKGTFLGTFDGIGNLWLC